MMNKIYWLLFICCSFSITYAQQQNPIAVTQEEKNTPVELLHAGKLIGNVINNEKVRIVVKDSTNNVGFRQNNSILYCDSAIHFLAQNKVNAYHNIRIIDSDGTIITGDSLLYDGTTRIARLRGNVVLTDENRTVSTCCMDYNLKTKVGNYFNGGTVIDNGTTLVSDKGYYYTTSKIVYFRDNVDYRSPDTQLRSDTLTYNLAQKKVIFNSKTFIKTKDGEVVTNKGYHMTESGKSFLDGRSKIDNAEYAISGDVLDYNKKTGKGIAKGNVEFYNKKDNIIILGDLGKHDDKTKRSEVYGNAVMIKPIEEKGRLRPRDTLFLSADTLIAVNDTTKARRLYAYNHVKMYRSDFQAKCDSLVYQITDSTLHFYYSPILWAKNSQMVGDSIVIHMKKNQIDQMNLYQKAFIISKDTLKQFNQVKGRTILAKFKNNEIKNVDVNGNAESMYYVLEKDSVLMGLNSIKAAEMFMVFNDSSKLDEILFKSQPEGKFVPPHEITESSSRLKDFAWKIDERPEKGEVLGIHNKNRFRSGELANAMMIVDDVFQVFMKEQRLYFYKAGAEERNILSKFFVLVYAKDKNDLPIDNRKDGYIDLGFEFPPNNLLNGVAKHDIALPAYSLTKIVIGQKGKTKGVIWQKIYEFPKKRERKPKKV